VKQGLKLPGANVRGGALMHCVRLKMRRRMSCKLLAQRSISAVQVRC
jgi:hypothetical protein